MKRHDRREEVLQHAGLLLQTRGFNAFSHRDLADLVGIKSSSIHYHFPSKEDLGIALIQKYRGEIEIYLASLEGLPAEERVDSFVQVFVEPAMTDTRWCLAGMLASDYETYGESLQLEVRRFFNLIEKWFSQQVLVLKPGFAEPDALALGKAAVALLEGALLLARVHGEPHRVESAANIFKNLLK